MLIIASHLRQSNVSKAKLSGLDLLANMATPQIGQCLMDFRRSVIAFAPKRPRHLCLPVREGNRHRADFTRSSGRLDPP
jgi:hypothetical protein